MKKLFLLFSFLFVSLPILAQTNTFCATNQNCQYTGIGDYTNAQLLKARISAGLSTSVNGDFGYDTTSSNWHFFANGLDMLAPLTTPGIQTNGHCSSWIVSGGRVTLGDTPCSNGTVSSVGLALPASVFNISGSPVTGSGTLTATFANFNAHTVLGNNTGSSATPGPVQLACGDLSNSGNSCTYGATASTNNRVTKFATGSGFVDGSMIDDGTNPVQSPDGLDVVQNCLWNEYTVDTGGVTANKLACRSSVNKVVICPAGTTQGVLGVAYSTVSSGGTVLVCRLGRGNAIVSNNFTSGNWAIPSATVAGDLDDTGSTSQPTNVIQTFLEQSSGSAGATTIVDILTPDTISGAGGVVSAVFPYGGDGVDGSVIADGSTTVTCLGAPSSSIYTMTRDCNFTSLTVNNGATVKENNFAIQANGTCTINGTVSNNGSTGANGGNAVSSTGGNSGGTTNAAGSSVGHYTRLQISVAGTAGGNGGTTTGSQAASANGGNVANPAIDSSGGTGASGNSGGLGGTGASGAGGAVRTGGNGGVVSSIAAISGHNAMSLFNGGFYNSSGLGTTWKAYVPPNGGNGGAPGGGGGGGDGANSGGGGGAGGTEGGGGGWNLISCKAINVGSTGIISADGGTGGNGGNGFTPTAGNTGGGGGGAGGSGGTGGIVGLTSLSFSNAGSNNIHANGGNGGSGGAKGSPHGTGTDNATAGSPGPNGPAGIVINLQLK